MRLFVAIDVPEEIKEFIKGIQEKIGNDLAKIRFVEKNQVHITLKFLGEVQPDKIETIKKELRKIQIQPFTIYLDSIDIFPNKNYIRVMWIGLKPEDQIIDLQKEIDENLKGLFKKDKKFKPHLTLARVKFIEDKAKFIERLNGIKVERKSFYVNNIKLKKSTLTRKGPIYDDVETFGII